MYGANECGKFKQLKNASRKREKEEGKVKKYSTDKTTPAILI